MKSYRDTGSCQSFTLSYFNYILNGLFVCLFVCLFFVAEITKFAAQKLLMPVLAEMVLCLCVPRLSSL